MAATELYSGVLDSNHTRVPTSGDFNVTPSGDSKSLLVLVWATTYWSGHSVGTVVGSSTTWVDFNDGGTPNAEYVEYYNNDVERCIGFSIADGDGVTDEDLYFTLDASGSGCTYYSVYEVPNVDKTGGIANAIEEIVNDSSGDDNSAAQSGSVTFAGSSADNERIIAGRTAATSPTMTLTDWTELTLETSASPNCQFRVWNKKDDNTATATWDATNREFAILGIEFVDDSGGTPIVETVGQITETETPQTITGVKGVPYGPALESEVPLPIDPVKPIIVSMGTVVEAESPTSVAVLKNQRVSVTQVTETDVPQPIAVDKEIVTPVGQVTETESTQPVVTVKPIIGALGVSTETEAPQVIDAVKEIVEPIGQVTEVDTALEIAVPNATQLGTVTETESGQPIDPIKNLVTPVGLVTETESPQAIDVIKNIVTALGQAIDYETAQSIGSPTVPRFERTYSASVSSRQLSPDSSGEYADHPLLGAVSLGIYADQLHTGEGTFSASVEADMNTSVSDAHDNGYMLLPRCFNGHRSATWPTYGLELELIDTETGQPVTMPAASDPEHKRVWRQQTDWFQAWVDGPCPQDASHTRGEHIIGLPVSFATENGTEQNQERGTAATYTDDGDGITLASGVNNSQTSFNLNTAPTGSWPTGPALLRLDGGTEHVYQLSRFGTTITLASDGRGWCKDAAVGHATVTVEYASTDTYGPFTHDGKTTSGYWDQYVTNENEWQAKIGDVDRRRRILKYAWRDSIRYQLYAFQNSIRSDASRIMTMWAGGSVFSDSWAQSDELAEELCVMAGDRLLCMVTNLEQDYSTNNPNAFDWLNKCWKNGAVIMAQTRGVSILTLDLTGTNNLVEAFEDGTKLWPLIHGEIQPQRLDTVDVGDTDAYGGYAGHINDEQGNYLIGESQGLDETDTRQAPSAQSTPYAALWAALPFSVPDADNTDARVAEIVSDYKELWYLGQRFAPWESSNDDGGGEKTFLERLTTANGGTFPIGGYTNGTYVDQAFDEYLPDANNSITVFEADLLEQKMAAVGERLVQVFWPPFYASSGMGYPTGGNPSGWGGVLSSSINTTQTTITVDETHADNRPSGSSNEWPYVESKVGAGTYSKDLQDAVAWILIEDPATPGQGEIMRINTVSHNGDGTIDLTGVRGTWGTTAVGTDGDAGDAGDRVFVPIYIGGQEFNGIPWSAGGSATDPTRYAFEMSHPDLIDWKTQRLADIYSDPAWDTVPPLVHYDISSGAPYNLNDPEGRLSEPPYPEKPYPWNFTIDALVTRAQHREEQLEKFSQYKTHLSALGYDMIDQANSLTPFNTTEMPENELFMNDARCPDRVTYEFWLQNAQSTINYLQVEALVNRANQPSRHCVIWWKEPQVSYASDTVYRKFTYCTYLLAASNLTPWVVFGGQDMASTSSPSTANVSRPNQLFMVHLGDPIATPADWDDLNSTYTEVKGFGNISSSGNEAVRRRDFQYGVSVVNNTDSSYNFTVPSGDWWIITESSITQAGATVNIPSKDSLLLAFEPVGAGGGATDNLQSRMLEWHTENETHMDLSDEETVTAGATQYDAVVPNSHAITADLKDGEMAARFDLVAGSGDCVVRWGETSFDASEFRAGDTRWRFDGWDSTVHLRLFKIWSALPTNLCFVRLNTSGYIDIFDGSSIQATMNTQVATGQKIRIVALVRAATTGATVVVHYWEDPNDPTPTETIEATYDMADDQISQVSIGSSGRSGSSEAITFWLYEAGLSTTSFSQDLLTVPDTVPMWMAEETESTQPLSLIQPNSGELGTIVEVESPQPIDPVKHIYQLLGTVTETETPQGLTGVHISPLGTVAETETGQSISPIKVAGIGTVAETESAQLITPVFQTLVPMGTVSETEIVQDLLVDKPIFQALGTVTETESVQMIALLGETRTPIGTVVETEITQGVAVSKHIIIPLGLITESETPQGLTVVSTSTIGTVTESEAAQIIQKLHPIIQALGTATETESLYNILGRVGIPTYLVPSTALQNVEHVTILQNMEQGGGVQ